ncbi:MAG: hypothetical protein FWD76_02020 [Firmicutes bacterium]|nr:hypothetical protein [Bacillota bacterium]
MKIVKSTQGVESAKSTKQGRLARMTKKRWVAVVALSLCFVFLGAMGAGFVNRAEAVDDSNPIVLVNTIKDELSQTPTKDEGEIDMQKVDLLVLSEPGFEGRDILVIKELSDANGYTYFDIEFVGGGFLICDNEFSVVIESNQVASPYENVSGNLLYLGPTRYYTMPSKQPKNGSMLFEHTVLDSKIETSDLEWLRTPSQQMADAAKEYQAAYQQNPKAALMRSGEQKAYLSHKDRLAADDDRHSFDYNITGNCGYVAATMVADYWADVKGYGNLLPGHEWFGEKYDYRGGDLVRQVQGDMRDDVIGIDLLGAMQVWSKGRGYPSLIPQLSYVPAPRTLYDILAKDRPLILGGMLENPQDGGTVSHAVTVHGVRRWNNTLLGITVGYSDYVYEVNYGWTPDYNNHHIRDKFLSANRGFVVAY